MRPAITSRAPIQMTPTTPAKTKKITSTVRSERATTRARAAENAASAFSEKVSRAWSS